MRGCGMAEGGDVKDGRETAVAGTAMAHLDMPYPTKY
jgi:hypothetical protein